MRFPAKSPGYPLLGATVGILLSGCAETTRLQGADRVLWERCNTENWIPAYANTPILRAQGCEAKVAEMRGRPPPPKPTSILDAQLPVPRQPAQLPPRARPEANAQPAATAPSGGLTPAQTASCTREIQDLQVASQRWGGNVNDTALRLGRMQKDLFEGRCAGHPEARAYIAGANKMIAASSGGTGGSGSPDRNRSRKVHNPAADAKGCTALTQGRERGALSSISGNKTFVNNCPTSVEFFWCSDDECTRDRGNTWTIHAGGSWPVDGNNVRWGACRGRDSGGFDDGSQGQRYTCPNLTW
jgi:hypothetical protein